ncbi:hypothetical protein AVEN_267227-1 [Araneus ventricosus]|uniref:Uncharacterized protein n=1 Tax=Araneus ventricosus TaxID=182803 RepID=A0A4Y2L2F5_ARAVE|nr:hypothetical protein AVEN_267227-1 [Araneus ventricosus]
MSKGQEEMRKGQEEMRKGQEEMRKGQEEMKSQIQAHVESQVGEIKDHVNSCIEKIADVYWMGLFIIVVSYTVSFKEYQPRTKNIFSFRFKNTKIINGKIKAEARPHRPNRPWGPQLEQHQPLAQPITKEVQIVTKNDSRYRRPKPDYAKFLRENKMAKK